MTNYYFRNKKGQIVFGKIAHTEEEARAILEKANKRGWGWTYEKEEFDLEERIARAIKEENKVTDYNKMRRESYEWR